MQVSADRNNLDAVSSSPASSSGGIKPAQLSSSRVVTISAAATGNQVFRQPAATNPLSSSSCSTAFASSLVCASSTTYNVLTTSVTADFAVTGSSSSAVNILPNNNKAVVPQVTVSATNLPPSPVLSTTLTPCGSDENPAAVGGNTWNASINSASASGGYSFSCSTSSSCFSMNEKSSSSPGSATTSAVTSSSSSTSTGPTGMTSTSAGTTTTRQKGCIQVGFYDIDRTIGKGNFATVKLAKHRITKSRVALKIINKKQLDESDLMKTYREINILKKLHHVNIVRLYQVMASNNMLYLVTEHASNGELFEFLAEHGRMEEPEAQRIFWQIILAVEYCHQQGIVHRDLKVENLLFDSYWDIKIADFGFSNTYKPNKLLDTWCGSPPYAAPEIFQGQDYDGQKLDIWSMGVILYVLVCGCLPFDGDTLQELRERVLCGRYRVPYFLSQNCESLIQKILVLDPVKRYTVAQIKEHSWMYRETDDDIYNGSGSSMARSSSSTAVLDEHVLQAMKNLGLDSEKTISSIQEEKYDHYYAIYHLLLEKFENMGPIILNVSNPKQTVQNQNFNSSCDSSMSVTSSSISLDQKCESLTRQKSCSPKGSIGTPSIDEGFSSDVSFDADQSMSGKEASMEQMTPIKEDPEEQNRLAAGSSPQSRRASNNNGESINSCATVSTSSQHHQHHLDFDTSWQTHQFPQMKFPIQVQSPSMAKTDSLGATNSLLTPRNSGDPTDTPPTVITTLSGVVPPITNVNPSISTYLHSSYDEVSGERMLVNLGGHSNFSSLESQCSEYSSNISLDTNQQHSLSFSSSITAAKAGNGSVGVSNNIKSLSPQVSLNRPPLVHQQRIGDYFSGNITGTTFLECGRRASESNLNEQDPASLEPDPKNMKHQLKPYNIQTLSYLETTASPNSNNIAHASRLQAKSLSKHSNQVPGTSSLMASSEVFSSAPNSPAVPTKRLMKQRTILHQTRSFLSPEDVSLDSRPQQHNRNICQNNSKVSQVYNTLQFLSPLTMSHDIFSHQHCLRETSEISKTSANMSLLAQTTKFSLLPKPHSFDETQSHNRVNEQNSIAASSEMYGSGGVYLNADNKLSYTRQHSFDATSRLHHQSSTEEQSGDDLSHLGGSNSPNFSAKERMIKSQRRLVSPYHLKQQPSAPNSGVTGGVLARRNTLHRQYTLRPQCVLERQLSKCSNSPPRNPAYESDSNNSQPSVMATSASCPNNPMAPSSCSSSANSLTNPHLIPPTAAGVSGVSTTFPQQPDLTCLLQQMELRASSPSSLRPMCRSTSLADSYPPLATPVGSSTSFPSHMGGGFRSASPTPGANQSCNATAGAPQLKYSYSSYYSSLNSASTSCQQGGGAFSKSACIQTSHHHQQQQQQRKHLATAIPSISFESAEGIICYLDVQQPSMSGPSVDHNFTDAALHQQLSSMDSSSLQPEVQEIHSVNVKTINVPSNIATTESGETLYLLNQFAVPSEGEPLQQPMEGLEYSSPMEQE